MASIIYGVNGEGSGHWTRSREVMMHLRNQGHDIIVLTSGRALDNLRRDFNVEEIFGFRFRFRNGRIDELKSFAANADVIPEAAVSLRKAAKIYKDRNISLVITDFEPISCLAAGLNGIPVISIDNQRVLSRSSGRHHPLRHAAQAQVTKVAIELMTPGAKAYLALSFFEPRILDKRTFLFPPIVRREIFSLRQAEGDYLLCYFTQGSGRFLDELKKVPYRFVIYGADEDREEGNLSFRKFHHDRFLRDLAGAGGVFATAGFSLISEALYLGKPYLAWPVPNQYEQIFNAYHLNRLNYGKFIRTPDAAEISSFIDKLGYYRSCLKIYRREDNRRLFAKVDSLISELA